MPLAIFDDTQFLTAVPKSYGYKLGIPIQNNLIKRNGVTTNFGLGSKNNRIRPPSLKMS